MSVAYRFRITRGRAAVFAAAAALTLASPTAFAQIGTPAAPDSAGAPAAATAAPPPAAPVAAVPLSPIGPDGARELDRRFSAAFADWLAKNKLAGVVAWKDGRQPTTAAVGDHYEMTLPPLVVTSAADGNVAEIAASTFQVKPNSDDTLAISGTLPKTITAMDKGKIAGTIDLGEQSLAATLLPEFSAVIKIDYKSSGLTILDPEDQSGVKTGEIRYAADMKPDANKLYSGPYELSIANLVGKDKGGTDKVLIGRASMKGAISRANLAVFRDFGAFIGEMNARNAQPEGDQILAHLAGALGGVGAAVAFEDVKIVGVDKPTDVYTAGKLAMEFGVADLDTPTSAARVGYTVVNQALPLPPEAQAYAKLIPTNSVISIEIAKIPTDTLKQILSVNSPEGPNPMAALAGLQEAGTEVSLKTVSLDAADANATATGAVHFQPGAIYGAVGGVTMTLRGLETVAAQLKPLGKDAEEALSAITVLQMMGQQGKDAQGRDIRTFKLDLTPQGQILLNGADLSALMNAAEAPKDQPAPKPQKPKK